MYTILSLPPMSYDTFTSSGHRKPLPLCVTPISRTSPWVSPPSWTHSLTLFGNSLVFTFLPEGPSPVSYPFPYQSFRCNRPIHSSNPVVHEHLVISGSGTPVGVPFLLTGHETPPEVRVGLVKEVGTEWSGVTRRHSSCRYVMIAVFYKIRRVLVVILTFVRNLLLSTLLRSGPNKRLFFGVPQEPHLHLCPALFHLLTLNRSRTTTKLQTPLRNSPSLITPLDTTFVHLTVGQPPCLWSLLFAKYPLIGLTSTSRTSYPPEHTCVTLTYWLMCLLRPPDLSFVKRDFLEKWHHVTVP